MVAACCCVEGWATCCSIWILAPAYRWMHAGPPPDSVCTLLMTWHRDCVRSSGRVGKDCVSVRRMGRVRCRKPGTRRQPATEREGLRTETMDRWIAFRGCARGGCASYVYQIGRPCQGQVGGIRAIGP